MAVDLASTHDTHSAESEKYKSSALEKRAPLVATALSLLLAIIKLTVGIMSGSVALLASAVDSIMDMFVSVFNFLAIRLSDKNPDAQFQFGYGKVEALAATLEGLVVMGSGLFILYEALQKLIHKESVTHVPLSIAVMAASIIIVGILVAFLAYVVKKTNNMVIRADLLHYKTDLYSNGAVILSLGIIYFTEWYWVDILFGAAIGIYIIKEAYELVEEGTHILLDVSLPKEEVEQILKILKRDTRITDFHFLKTRYAGKYKFVEMHIVLEPDIKLSQAHHIADSIEEKIKQIDPNSRWHILIHLDPYDDSDMHDY
ncbi:MAG TPA: cation transporter [Campylobacteraceae bacterium]|nr:cation transporter [Campylobacteraceae bacterium]